VKRPARNDGAFCFMGLNHDLLELMTRRSQSKLLAAQGDAGFTMSFIRC